MRDIGLIEFGEPFKRLLTQGMVIGETFYDDKSGKRTYLSPESVKVERDQKGKIISAVSSDGKQLKHAIERMSKSKGNGVDPDEMVEIYGADAARLFVLFAAPIENELVWNEAGIEGAVRFLQRVWRLVHKWTGAGWPSQPGGMKAGEARQLRRKTHQTIKRVRESIETLQLNTPVAALMELSNAISDLGGDPSQAGEEMSFAVREALTALTIMLTPFSPHVGEEFFAAITGSEEGMLSNGARFPAFEEDLAKADLVEIPVQVNGKLRSRLMAPPESSKEALEEMAVADEKIHEHIKDREIARIIFVPGRLLNIVIKN